MLKNKLNIVNEKDEVVGTEDREVIHEKGLRHREVHVFFVTPLGEIIFQHRAKDKDTFPDLLDATVGGHVEIGDSYDITALKEAFEETGVTINPDDLTFVKKVCKSLMDEATGKINHSFQSKYIYIYGGRLENLKVEEGMGIGFEVWNIERLLKVTDKEKARFIPFAYELATTVVFDFIKSKLK